MTAAASAVAALAVAVGRAAAYLVAGQDRTGSWTDLRLAPGPSDAWATALVGRALAAAGWRDPADRAAGWLLAHDRTQGVWGWNADVPPDVDSTAQAVLLLRATDRAAPEGALRYLAALRTQAGWPTYPRGHPAQAWTEPTVDVSAAALLALGESAPDTWARLVGDRQGADGTWTGLWWATPAYPTMVALEAWAAMGRPPLRHPVPRAARTAFDAACALRTDALLARAPDPDLVDALLAQQLPDGSWPGRPFLRIPDPRGAGAARVVGDDRRLLTTAMVLAGLVSLIGPAAPSLIGPGALAGPPLRGSGARARSRAGAHADGLVSAVARASGLDRAGAALALTAFRTLTAESLAEPSPWPSSQLSTLAGGIPLEFSATVGPAARPALRLTTEVGRPEAPIVRRARSGLTALASTAQRLGLGQAWAGLSPALEVLVDPTLPVPDGLRFWVWAGMDLEPVGQAVSPVLKAYVNALAHEVGGQRARLAAALAALGVPVDGEREEALRRLDAVGFLHEVGLGAASGGRRAVKVYYELAGWRPTLVGELVGLLGLDPSGAAPGAVPDDSPDLSLLMPEVPGLLRASLATRTRAGIALRIDVPSGAVRDLTVATAFPAPLLPAAEVAARVAGWVDSLGGDPTPHHDLARVLIPGHTASPDGGGRAYSLFTRTIGPRGAHSTVYIRPAWPTFGRAGGPASEVAAS